jgi:hypothetical protein
LLESNYIDDIQMLRRPRNKQHNINTASQHSLDIRKTDSADIQLLSIAFAYQMQGDDTNAARILSVGKRAFAGDPIFAELLSMNRSRAKRR